jgi:phenylpropionate dioxygenase-like ring-hydroxylating dioxygenase large terminal subunit
MQENALDPSHASYVHHGVISRRQDAAPMRMRLSGDIDAQRGFQLAHGGYSRPQQEGGMRARRWFIPPCTIRCCCFCSFVCCVGCICNNQEPQSVACRGDATASGGPELLCFRRHCCTIASGAAQAGTTPLGCQVAPP